MSVAIEGKAPYRYTDTVKLLVAAPHLRKRSGQHATVPSAMMKPPLDAITKPPLDAIAKPPLDGRIQYGGAAHVQIPQERQETQNSNVHPLLRMPRQKPDKTHPLLSSRQEPEKTHPLLSNSQVPDKKHRLPSSSKPSALKSHRRSHSTPLNPTALPDRNVVIEDPLNDLVDNLNNCRSLHGDAHRKTALCHNLVGNHHFRRSGFDDAIEAYENALRCYKLASKNSTRDKIAIAATLGNIGAVYWRTGKMKQAISSLEEAHFTQVQAFSAAKERIDDNEDVANTLFNLGMARSLDGDYVNALDALMRAKDILAARYGPTHAEVARAIDATGQVHLLKGDVDRAIQCHSDALRVKRNILGSRHPSVLQSMTNVASAYRAKGELEEAARMYREVLSARKVALYRESKPEMRRALAADIGEAVRVIGEIQKECSKTSEENMDTILEEKDNYASEGIKLSKDDWF